MYSVYVRGFVANLGTRVLIEKKIDELSRHFSEEYLHLLSQDLDKTIEDGVIPSLSILDKNIIETEEIAKGGVLTALWKICDRNKWGLKYSLRKIPILQGSIEIANFFDLNPYRLLTANANLIVIDTDEDVLHESFVKIGEITTLKKRVRIDGESEAFLTKDYKDEIDKVIAKYTSHNICQK